ncbi:TPA: hypothetical protein N0F65_011302 [Lagenidium giganteum]|uniref:Uncharacterized protein n=1 Tax=Lagenidium giganteum TaxID=4803 RepID=A0AAV2YI68_9STRA|nr:TPA: hypothetical protein N0F65_011302 [Lagenidium giganteum]
MAAHSKAETLLSDCMVVAGCHTQAQVITKHLDILLHLCVDGISKEDWTAQGSLPMRVLRWLVTQVTLPNLGGDKLGRLLKAVFPLVEDLNDSTQLVGMHMLRHIVFNVTATELRWYGVVLAMLAVGSDLQPYDDCFLRVLNDASLCSDVHLRRIYLVRLRSAIERMGAPHSLHLVRYLQPLLKVLLASFESVNADLLIDALQTLETTVRGAWPRIPAHSEEIVVGVFRVVAFCEMFDGTPPHAPSVDIKQTLLDTCAKVLQLVRDLDQARTDEMINKISAECRPLDRFCAQIVTQEKR